MRARKPWVRARFILLGWYVRFMASYLVIEPAGVAPSFLEGGKGTQMARQCQQSRVFGRIQGLSNLWITASGGCRCYALDCSIVRFLC